MMAAGVINVSVANIYETDAYRSQVVTQGILGEEVKILEQKQNFTFVELPDTYRGWISNFQLVLKNKHPEEDQVMVRDHWIHIYREPRVGSPVIRDAVIGTRLNQSGFDGNWLQIQLPDGESGWIKKSVTGSFPPSGREGIITLAGEFIGYPYFWGGRSPKGFDCSGLTQTVFGLLGIKLPRDSWMQQSAGKRVETQPADAKPGDLYFFAERGDRITHVGIALGSGRILHARGYVRINSLVENDPVFSDDLRSIFVDVRSFL